MLSLYISYQAFHKKYWFVDSRQTPPNQPYTQNSFEKTILFMIFSLFLLRKCTILETLKTKKNCLPIAHIVGRETSNQLFLEFGLRMQIFVVFILVYNHDKHSYLLCINIYIYINNQDPYNRYKGSTLYIVNVFLLLSHMIQKTMWDVAITKQKTVI